MPIHNHYNFADVEGIRVGRFNQGLNSTFILYRIDDTIIDCGPINQWRVVQKFLDQKPIRQLLMTHHHEDHSGNAAFIAERYNITPYAPQLSERKLKSGFQIPLWQKIYWGKIRPITTQPYIDEIKLSDGDVVEVLHTPGHAKDHHCLFVPKKGWIFTADLYLARKLKYLRADENLDQLIKSIKIVLSLDFDTIFCAHRGIVENGKGPLSDKLTFLLDLCEKAQALEKKGFELEEITKNLLGKEDFFATISGYNFSKRNLIEEALKVDI